MQKSAHFDRKAISDIKQQQGDKTRDILAKVAGVSHDTYDKGEKLIQHAPEEVKEQLRSGEISINKAYKDMKREQAAKEKAERKAYVLTPEMPEDACKLFTADIREGLPQVPDASVDFIITDPPYPKEYLPLFGDLSRLASRVLKPGGSLIVMSGQSYLQEVIEQLSTAMRYYWISAYLTPGPSTQLWQRKVSTTWKPLFWYVKENYTGPYVGDVFRSPGVDKQYHEWGQSEGGMIDIVQKLTDAGNVILDPFLGGGTTGVAAVTLGRKFIGADIEQKNIEIARERINESYAHAKSQA